MDRIVQHPVLKINQERKSILFNFNGESVQGYENEPVSSALIANGVKEFSIHQIDDAPQGIFCANGQCSHCTLIINGKPLKSCITPLKEGMEVRTLVHLPELPVDDRNIEHFEIKNLKCDYNAQMASMDLTKYQSALKLAVSRVLKLNGRKN